MLVFFVLIWLLVTLWVGLLYLCLVLFCLVGVCCVDCWVSVVTGLAIVYF